MHRLDSSLHLDILSDNIHNALGNIHDALSAAIGLLGFRSSLLVWP